MRAKRWSALVLSGITFAQLWVPAAYAAGDTTVIVASRTARSAAQPIAEVALVARLAHEWGLEPQEWARYRQLMKGPLGIWSPHLDPLTALGIEARSAAERDHYAALEVRMEGERVAKILSFQRAYDAAWKRLYPHLLPVDFAAVPGESPQAAKTRDSDRLAIFVKDPCPTCVARVKTLEAQGRALDIYMVGLEDDQELRAWAVRVGIDPAKVRSGTVTLNHDAGRWLAVGDEKSLPAVLVSVDGQWRRE